MLPFGTKLFTYQVLFFRLPNPLDCAMAEVLED